MCRSKQTPWATGGWQQLPSSANIHANYNSCCGPQQGWALCPLPEAGHDGEPS